MKKARQLVDEGGVRIVPGKDGEYEAYVKGTKGDHFVQVALESCRCTCDWFAKNQGDRGPCSHVLAAEIVMQAEEAK